MRALMGMVQALVVPGIWRAPFISVTSSSQDRRSGQIRRHTRLLSHSGDHEEYQRRFGRHSLGGFRTTVVSIIENGAGSVEVSARPAFPKTRSTSGNDLRMRSWTCRTRLASVTDRPGKVVGMYRIVPSLRGGMNSCPRRRYAGTVLATMSTATAMVVFGRRSTARQAGS